MEMSEPERLTLTERSSCDEHIRPETRPSTFYRTFLYFDFWVPAAVNSVYSLISFIIIYIVSLFPAAQQFVFLSLIILL